jgi:tRNA threonylcarbamoyladenosine biosynthesis protein TsaB
LTSQNDSSTHKPLKLLALDTSTELLSLALSHGAEVFSLETEGGAAASKQTLPQILSLLAQAHMKIDDLDAVVFGQGPGSFTGLRTACAVAQGLGLGARAGQGIPVLPVPCLLAVAEQARLELTTSHPKRELEADGGLMPISVAMDARMKELYVAHYLIGDPAAKDAAHWLAQALSAPVTTLAPAKLPSLLATQWAGNAARAYPQELAANRAASAMHFALPTATAMLRLAPALWRMGCAVNAALAVPHYVRNQVALTTAERAQQAAMKLNSA